jgi:hypothetical protein
MRVEIAALLIAFGSSAAVAKDIRKPLRLATSCLFESEQVSGLNTICFYSCLSGTRAITVPAASICPLVIDE